MGFVPKLPHALEAIWSQGLEGLSTNSQGKAVLDSFGLTSVCPSSSRRGNAGSSVCAWRSESSSCSKTFCEGSSKRRALSRGDAQLTLRGGGACAGLLARCGRTCVHAVACDVFSERRFAGLPSTLHVAALRSAETVFPTPLACIFQEIFNKSL